MAVTNPEYESDLEFNQELERRRGNGCVKGCLILVLILVLIVVALTIGGYYFLKSQIGKYTSDKPAEIPSIVISEEELAELQSKIESFEDSFENDNPNAEQPNSIELILTEGEINSLIASNPDLANRVYIKINEGTVRAELSIPMDAVPGGKGRFFNATASLNVSMENGLLLITLADASVKGQQVPQQYLAPLQSENLAVELYKDPEIVKVLQRIKELRVEDKKVFLVTTPKAALDNASEEADLVEEKSDPAEN